MARRQSPSPVAGAPAASCRGRALALLAARARSEEELRRKLLERGFPEDEVAQTVSELLASGALSEAESAGIFVRLRRHRWGRERLEIELRKRLFREETIRETLAEFGADEELALARRLSGARTPRGDEAGERRRIFSRLRRKGISAAVAMRVVGPGRGGDE